MGKRWFWSAKPPEKLALPGRAEDGNLNSDTSKSRPDLTGVPPEGSSSARLSGQDVRDTADTTADDGDTIPAAHGPAKIPSESLFPIPSTQQSSEVTTARSNTGIKEVSAPDPPYVSVSEQTNTVRHRISFRSLAFFYGRDERTIPSSPSSTTVNRDDTKRKPLPKQKVSRSEKESRSAAIALRTLMMGPNSLPPPRDRSSSKVLTKASSVPPPPDIKKVKEQLLKPKSANAIIRQLRRLPLPDGPSFHPGGRTSTESLVTHPDIGGAPIHAVCLPCTDEEAERLHFSRLQSNNVQTPLLSPTVPSQSSAHSSDQPNISTASLESLISVLQSLQPMSLLESPDLGFGQPVTDEGSGPLAGSVPSPQTILDGFELITTQLMALGFATTKTIYPSHKGMHPPEDRLSVLTCTF
jgi:hypothetical protein